MCLLQKNRRCGFRSVCACVAAALTTAERKHGARSRVQARIKPSAHGSDAGTCQYGPGLKVTV